MIKIAIIAAVAVSALPSAAFAADPAKPAAAVATPVKAKYSSGETDIGTLLDDPAAKAIVEKHIPGLTTNEQIDMARSMTLKAIQTYSPEQVTDERLAIIDAELAKLK